MNISVLGCGRWGSFIAWYQNKIGNDVYCWGMPNCPEIVQLKNNHKNDYLSFDKSMTFTEDLKQAIDHAEVIIISISSQNLRSFMADVSKHNLKNKIIVLCMKGIEETTGLRLTQVVGEFINQNETPIAIWVGPGHPQDFVRNIPNCMVIDSDNKEAKKLLVTSFNSELIRFYYGSDLIGNEVGAAAKNVIGIAAGMLDGFNYTSLKGALMSRGTREISRLMEAMGGSEISAYGLCHLGDYEATLFSPFSHNRKYGEMIVQGKSFDKLAEGVSTTRALLKLSKQYNVDLPIVEAVNDVISNNMNPSEVLSNLFERSIKKEF